MRSGVAHAERRVGPVPTRAARAAGLILERLFSASLRPARADAGQTAIAGSGRRFAVYY